MFITSMMQKLNMDIKSMTNVELLQLQAAIVAELSGRLAGCSKKSQTQTPKEEDAPARCAKPWHNTERVFRSLLTCRDQARLCVSSMDFGH